MQYHSKAKLEGAGAPLSRILPYFPPLHSLLPVLYFSSSPLFLPLFLLLPSFSCPLSSYSTQPFT